MKGLTVVRNNRVKVTAKMHAAAALALEDGANELKRVANQTVPYEEHILEESAAVSVDEAALLAQVGYGGEAGAYAARQHEETLWHHKPGRRFKWLEMAAKEDGKRIMLWVGKQMKAKL